MRKNYPSDMSKEHFELILADLESARKKQSRARLICVIYSVYYVLKIACQCRMLHRDFPQWESVCFYFKI